jgi:hypothetical protein
VSIWVDSESAQLVRKRSLNLAVIFRMVAGDHVTRLWAGHGDFRAPADTVEDDATNIYKGIGDLLDLPELSQLINGEADRVSFDLSGLTQEAAYLTEQASGDIENAPVNLGVLILGDDLKPVTETAWLWSGLADTLEHKYDGQVDPPVFSLSLSVATAQATRKRGSYVYYTDPQQKMRSPDDRMCERVSRFATGYRIEWPKF